MARSVGTRRRLNGAFVVLELAAATDDPQGLSGVGGNACPHTIGFKILNGGLLVFRQAAIGRLHFDHEGHRQGLADHLPGDSDRYVAHEIGAANAVAGFDAVVVPWTCNPVAMTAIAFGPHREDDLVHELVFTGT